MDIDLAEVKELIDPYFLLSRQLLAQSINFPNSRWFAGYKGH